MLLKLIKTPRVLVQLSHLNADEAIEQVKALREEYFQGVGADIYPPVKVEKYHVLHDPYEITHVNTATGQIGHFHTDTKFPSNCIAVVTHKPQGVTIHIYITDDEEAYLIGDTGQTVSVINGKPNKLKEAVTEFNRGQSLVKTN